MLVKSIFLCFLPALSGVFAKPGAWYQGLKKPLLNPPAWVFGPVWTILYLTMGFSHWIIAQQEDSELKRKSLKVFYAQLALNALWTPTFFGAREMGLAIIVLLALVLTLAVTIFYFMRLKKMAGLILLPYLIWSCFALYLNFAYYQLNP